MENKTPYSWDNNPGHLYTTKGIRCCEFTVYMPPRGSKIGNHGACAVKIGGKEEDNIRSVIEIYSADTKDHPKPVGHWNYARFSYVSCPINIVGNFTPLDTNKWHAMKALRKVAADRSSEVVELLEDPTPFNAQGKPNNTGILVATINDHRVSDYKNIPCTWACHKDVLRLDGWSSQDFTLISNREIDPTASSAASSVAKSDPRFGAKCHTAR